MSFVTNCSKRGFISYWRIENFDYRLDPYFSTVSPTFEIENLRTKWFIKIKVEDDYLVAYLFRESHRWHHDFYMSLLTASKWVPVLEETKRERESRRPDYWTLYEAQNGFKVVSLRDLRMSRDIYLPSGSLTIGFFIKWNKSWDEQCLRISRMINETELCHGTIEYFLNLKPSDLISLPSHRDFHNSGGLFQAQEPRAEMISQTTQTERSVDFKDAAELLELFKKNEFRFVTLRTSNRDFSVHKAALCLKSPVFNAMFEAQMQENECDLVKIDDIDSQTMASLVRFLHFQPLGELNWNDAVTLYYAADKYQIDSLKKKCVSFLKKELSVENICDAFLLADFHQDKELMSCAQEYFCKNSEVIFPTHQ